MIPEVVKPSIVLRKYIQYFCIVETDSTFNFFPKQRVYPYGSTILVFHYRNPSVFQPKGKQPYIEPRFVICGQQTNYYDLSLAGKTGMIFALFKPYGACMFFNIPMVELQNQNIALTEIDKENAVEFEGKLCNAKDNTKRIQIIEEYLLQKISTNKKNISQIENAVKLIDQTKGQIKIKNLASESCLGIKQFERKFLRYVGLNPKKYLSIVRFLNVLKKQRERNNRNFYSLAYENGYYDQSHFIYDIKNITGLTPKDFFKSLE